MDNREKPPRIGIIGGCGPYATLDIERKILEASMQKNPRLRCDQEYFPMIVMYATNLQDRLKAASGNGNTLALQLEKEIKQLAILNVDIALIACQGAHRFIKDESIFSGFHFVSMVDATVDHIVEKKSVIKRVGLLSTSALSESKLYQVALGENGITTITLPYLLQKKLDEIIYFIKSHGYETSKLLNLSSTGHADKLMEAPLWSELHKVRSDLFEIIAFMRAQEVDKLALACTELPLLEEFLSLHYDWNLFIDSNKVAATRVVEFASKLGTEAIL